MPTLLELTTSKGRRPSRSRRPPTFELLNAHAERRFEMIDKTMLVIPTDDYQRNEAQGKIAAEITMHYDMVSFGALLVIERPDGMLVVADGGTRLSAAEQRRDITEVPCLVYSGLTDKEEADVFLRINQNRQKLRVEQLHHAELFSDNDLALLSERMMNSLRENSVFFESLATMRAMCRRMPRATMAIVDILGNVANSRHVTARVMKGLVMLETMLNAEEKTLKVKRLTDRIAHEFSHLDKVVNVIVDSKTRQATAKTFAIAIAKTLHIRLKTSAN